MNTEVQCSVENWPMGELLNVRCASLASKEQWLLRSGVHTVRPGTFAQPQIHAASSATILGLLLLSKPVSRGSLTFCLSFYAEKF